MTHTSIDVGPELEEFAAVRYNGSGNPVPFYISDHPGASQVYSSSHDLIRFGLFHLKHTQPDQTQIISHETLDLMKRDSSPNPKYNGYGLPWRLKKDEYGYDVVWHTGSMRGTNVMLKFVPAEEIAVVVLINTSSDLRVKITNDIIGLLLPDYGAKWKVERDKPGGRPQPFKAVPALTGEWQGEIKTYEEVLPVTLLFQSDGDVHVRIQGQRNTLMNRVRFNNNFLTGTSYGSIPSEDARRHPHTISYRLLLQGKKLSGYVNTSFSTARSYGNFSSYIHLTKK